MQTIRNAQWESGSEKQKAEVLGHSIVSFVCKEMILKIIDESKVNSIVDWAVLVPVAL